MTHKGDNVMPSRRSFLHAAAGSAVALSGIRLAHALQGVTKDEIVIGSIQDLSGPIAVLGRYVQNGMILRAESINAAGGIHGRKIKLIVEDSSYDPKKSVLAAQKLVTQNRIFAMIGTLGSPTTLASMPVVLERNVLHLFPVSAHSATYEPFHKLKFSTAIPYPLSTRIGVEQMLKMKGYKRVAILYQDDEYGIDVLKGAEEALKGAGMSLVEKTSYKRGATEFSTQMQKLNAANPDLIVLATIVRETLGAIGAARQLGYKGDFLGSEAVHQPTVAKVGGKLVEGLYALNGTPAPYRGLPGNPKALEDWIESYKARFGEDPDVYSVGGWMGLDIFAKAAEKAGPNLNNDTLVQALETHPYPRGFLGNQEIAWSPTKRVGPSKVRVAQIQDGKWLGVTDFVN
jgi:branched-chain amino acid transport system substrate-binding protein